MIVVTGDLVGSKAPLAAVCALLLMVIVVMLMASDGDSFFFMLIVLGNAATSGDRDCSSVGNEDTIVAENGDSSIVCCESWM